jgi:hypothetical protein
LGEQLPASEVTQVCETVAQFDAPQQLLYKLADLASRNRMPDDDPIRFGIAIATGACSQHINELEQAEDTGD